MLHSETQEWLESGNNLVLQDVTVTAHLLAGIELCESSMMIGIGLHYPHANCICTMNQLMLEHGYSGI